MNVRIIADKLHKQSHEDSRYRTVLYETLQAYDKLSNILKIDLMFEAIIDTFHMLERFGIPLLKEKSLISMTGLSPKSDFCSRFNETFKYFDKEHKWRLKDEMITLARQNHRMNMYELGIVMLNAAPEEIFKFFDN